MQFKNTDKTIQQIANELGVAHVLEGSVRKAGNKIRVTAQLIKADDASHLWAKDYDRQLKDIFAVQDDVSNAIVEALKINLTSGQRAVATKRYTQNTDAYQLYLQGRFHWNKRATDEFLKAIEYFQQALKKDPRYALAYAGLSDSYAFLGDVGITAMPPREAFGKAKVEALKALEIDPSLSEAHNALGHILMHEWRWTDSENELKRAVELNPNFALAHGFSSLLLQAVGRVDEALAEAKLAKDLDPLSLPIHGFVGGLYILKKQFDQAQAEIQKMKELDPNYIPRFALFGRLYERMGRYEEAIAEFQTGVERTGGSMESKAPLAHAYARSGKPEEARKILAELNERSKERYVDPFRIAEIHVGLGQYDEAFEWLEKAYTTSSAGLVFVKIAPRLEPLHSDPRYAELLKKMGLEK